MKTLSWILPLMGKEKKPPFTPGPFKIEDDNREEGMEQTRVSYLGRRNRYTNNGGFVIADFYGPDRIANAKLMACAPYMMAAILSLLADEEKHERSGMTILTKAQKDMLLLAISAEDQNG